MTNDDLDFGQTVQGLVGGQFAFARFRLVRILGRGGMGVVWLARDERLEEEVALKFLPETVRMDSTAVDELKRETRKSRQLTHQSIVRIHDFVEDANGAAIAMEYISGQTLAEKRLEKPGRAFEPEDIRDWMIQVCEALDYAHRKAKIVHRDLKPANIMVTGSGHIKITDFGIARSISDSMSRVSIQRPGTSGSPPYMSPQQAAGEASMPTDDIYGLGATIYDLLTGKPPFFSGDIFRQIETRTPPSMGERRREFGFSMAPLPPEWESLVAACLAKDPQLRPQSLMEIANRLAGKAGASPLPERVPAKKPVRQLAYIAAAIVLMLMVMVFGVWHAGRKAPPAIAPPPVAQDDGAARQIAAKEEAAAREAADREKLAAARQKAEAEDAEQKLAAKKKAEQQAASAEQARLAEARAALVAQTLAAAREARQAGDWTRAETLIGNVLALDPTNASAHQLQGEINVAKLVPAATPPPTIPQATDLRWVFPDSSQRYLRPADLAGMDQNTLWRARNEIYVRRGYIFSTERGQKFAKSFGAAYQPRISGEAAITRALNPFEAANVEMLKAHENAR